MPKKKPRKEPVKALDLVLACPRCGGAQVTLGASHSISCSECGFGGSPRIFPSTEARQEYRAGREFSRMPELKLWEQKVMHGTIPVVVLVNWATAVYFVVFFTLGMCGFFRSELFQWIFLYSSIAVVALGFGVLSRWGKKRLSF